MTRPKFLDCVKPYADEYKVATKYGIPKRIEVHTPDSENPSTYQWLYTDQKGDENTFFFDADGHLLAHSTYTENATPTRTPSAYPTPSLLTVKDVCLSKGTDVVLHEWTFVSPLTPRPR